MKARQMGFSTAVAFVAMMLLTAYEPVLGAPPTGEVKTAAVSFGLQIPIPYIERSHALDWMELLYDHLVGCSPEGKLSPDLGLSNKWEMSPDGLTWTFHIRKGVKFHDGVELTAKDVKFSIEQLLLPDAMVSESAYVRENLKNVYVKDPYTVVIQCKKPSISMANVLSNMESPIGMVVPKDYYEKVGKDEFARHPIGSGPYRWHSQLVGSFIKLEATEKHWRDGVPQYKYMTYLVIPEEGSRISMLRTGEADISLIGREGVKEALSVGLNILTKENAAVVVLHPNMQWTSPAFSDIRFRKALNLAIDKNAIIKQLFAGLANPVAGYPGSTIFGIGGNRTLKPYPYDPQEARRLIKEGGWEKYEFTVLSYDRTGCPEFPRVVETVAGYWQKVGLNPKIRMSEWAVWRQAWNDRKTQNTIHGYDDSTNPDVVTILQKFQDKWNFAHKSKRSTVNIPELEEKFERMEKSMDINEISKLLTEIYRYAYDHYLMIPICETFDQIATKKGIPKWDLGLRRRDMNYYDLIRQR